MIHYLQDTYEMPDFTDGNQNKKADYVLNPCPAN